MDFRKVTPDPITYLLFTRPIRSQTTKLYNPHQYSFKHLSIDYIITSYGQTSGRYNLAVALNLAAFDLIIVVVKTLVYLPV